jgi:hypothetical protein
MKWIAIGLLASLVSLPVSAQPTTKPPKPPTKPTTSQPTAKPTAKPTSQPPLETSGTTTNKIKRIMGGDCVSELMDSTKKKTNVPCHHVVITGPDGASNSLNFHFDTEREDSGVSYVVSSQIQKDKEGRTYYPVVAMFTHKSGKASKIVRAEGLCSTDMKIKEIAVGCIAEATDGSSSKSVLGKKP